jgi:hypothetical protein
MVGTERRKETAMLDALQPLIGEARRELPATPVQPHAPRAPLLAPRRPASHTPARAIPLPRVVVPDACSPSLPAEKHPHQRTERWIYIVASVALAASIASWLAAEPRQLADGRTSSPVPVAQAPEVPSSDARLEISGVLPPNTVITANGRALSERALTITPGTYVLTASAPGHVTQSDTLLIGARRTVVWSPELRSVQPGVVRQARVATVEGR